MGLGANEQWRISFATFHLIGSKALVGLFAAPALSGPTFTTVVDASARGKPVKPDTALQGSVGGLGNPADTSAPAREEVALNPRGQWENYASQRLFDAFRKKTSNESKLCLSRKDASTIAAKCISQMSPSHHGGSWLFQYSFVGGSTSTILSLILFDVIFLNLHASPGLAMSRRIYNADIAV